MDDDEMQVFDVADFEIEQRLDAFARARLTPDPAAVARNRARVMRDARLQFDAAREAALLAPTVTPLRQRVVLRRLAVPALAASLWVGVAVGSVAASQAGGPLYSARLWVENATLPAAAADRTRSELSRLNNRLAEAMGAAARGDEGAVAAALDAYAEIAEDASAAAAGDDVLEDSVAAALDGHRVVLTAVADKLAENGNQTANLAVERSVERAIAHNAAVIARLDDTGKPAGSGAGAPGGSNGSAGSGSGTGDQGGGSSAGKPGSGSGGQGAGATGGNNGNTGSGATGGTGGHNGSGATGGTGSGTGGATGGTGGTGGDQGSGDTGGNGQDAGGSGKEPQATTPPVTPPPGDRGGDEDGQ